MKKYYFLVLLALFSIFSFGQTTYNATRNLKSGDVNSDPNWVWYENNIVQLYVEPNEAPINKPMPWFDNNGTAAIALNTGSNSTRDMYPSDGWVLIFRDFGTSIENQNLPHFILYNKYKGVLRLFFIDFVMSTSKTLYSVKLSHQFDDAITSANISSNSIDKGYLDFYDTDYSQIAICRASPGEWAYVDFDLSTYDPNLPDYLGFAFEINTVLQGNINLFANKLDEIDEKSPTTFDAINSTIKKTQDGIALGKKYFSTPKGFLDDMKKHADSNKGAWFEAPLRLISNSTIAQSIPVIGGIAGIITGFIGSDKGSNSSFTPFKITGDIKFESSRADILLWVPGSKRDETEGRGIPLYDRPLGIIGIYRPLIGTLTWGCGGKQVFEFDYTINPDASIKITEIEFGHKTDDGLMTYYSEKDFFKTFIWDEGDNYDIVLKMRVTSLCHTGKSAFIVKTFSNVRKECGKWLLSGEPKEKVYSDWTYIDYNPSNEPHYVHDFTLVSEGLSTFDNCTISFSAPTSITIKPGFHFKGGKIQLSTRHKDTYQKYLSGQFECSENTSQLNSLKSSINKGTNLTSDIPKIIENQSNSFVIYPNPFTDKIMIKPNKNNTDNYRVKIFNVNGTLLYDNLHIETTQIETNFLGSGFYILEIANNRANEFRQKIIKQ